MDLERIQAAVREAGLDGWLFYDFRGSDPLAYSILGLDPHGHSSRRWFYFVPANGEPTKILHSIERKSLDLVPGKKQIYLPWQQLQQLVRETLKGAHRIAMQYSPMNAIPYISRVDGGTVELVRDCGVEVVSSADLVQQFEAVWSPQQYESHQYAAARISQLIDDTFAEVVRRIREDGATNEFDVQQFMVAQYEANELETDYPPIVGVNANSANPHYQPAADLFEQIRAGDFLLIDTWAKQKAPGAVFFDVTWTCFLGEQVPGEIAKVFDIVRDARDAAIDFVAGRIRSDRTVCGWEVDDACRAVIEQAGYGDYFIHRTGHSIHTSTHGNGANMDNLETRDERQLISGTCFSVEPGIYLEGKFGVRSEVNVYVSENDIEVTGRPRQTEVICLPV